MIILDKDLYNNKSEKFHNFIDYINYNWKNAIIDSISTTAKLNQCSISTIHRFIKILDFYNYSEFKLFISNKGMKFNSQNLVIKNKKGINNIHNELIDQMTYNFKETFSEKVLTQIEVIGNSIMDNDGLIIFYNMNGTFLASLLRYKLNSIGFPTIVCKDENDFQNIISNLPNKKKWVSIIFTEKNLCKYSITLLKEINEFFIVTKQLKFEKQNVRELIYLKHLGWTKNNLDIDISRYMLHLIFVNHILKWIQFKTDIGLKNNK